MNISFQKPGETLRQTWRSRRDTKITRRNNKSKARETAEWRMVDGAGRRMRGRMKKGSVERVACRCCVKGNSKFTGGVLAEADEKFRENNDKIKRRNVCTHVARGESLGRFFHPSPLFSNVFLRFYAPYNLSSPPLLWNVGSSRVGRGRYRNCK